MPTIFESAKQSSSAEFSDELGDGGQSWKFQTPSPHLRPVLGNSGGRIYFMPHIPGLQWSSSEKAQSQQSGFSDVTLKTTKQ